MHPDTIYDPLSSASINGVNNYAPFDVILIFHSCAIMCLTSNI